MDNVNGGNFSLVENVIFAIAGQVKETVNQDSEVSLIIFYCAIQHRFPIYDKDILKIQ